MSNRDSWFSWFFGEDEDEDEQQQNEHQEMNQGGEVDEPTSRVSTRSRLRSQYTRSRHHHARKALRKTIGRGGGGRRNQNKE
jgi:hypothetical protein